MRLNIIGFVAVILALVSVLLPWWGLTATLELPYYTQGSLAGESGMPVNATFIHLDKVPLVYPPEDPTVGSEWHELHPELSNNYSITYHVDKDSSGEIDPCDQIVLQNLDTLSRNWYHVEWVTATILASTTRELQTGQMDLQNTSLQMDLTSLQMDLQNATLLNLTNPIYGGWNETYLVPSQTYNLTSWIDTDTSGNLTVGDKVDFNGTLIQWNVTTLEYGDICSMAVSSWLNISNPITSTLHETYPVLCQDHTLTSWTDTDTSGNLTVGDKVDFQDFPGVRWNVDTLEYGTISNMTVSSWRYIISNPITSKWHELSPEYCQDHTLTSWTDTDISRNLTVGDKVDFQDFPGMWWNVGTLEYGVNCSMAVSSWLNISNPKFSRWLEIQPVESNEYNLTSWVDTQPPGSPGYGNLSASDLIYLNLTDTAEVRWYHADKVEYEAICNMTVSESRYLEFNGTLDEFRELGDPIGTMWHEVYQIFSERYNLTSWVDDDMSGNLTYGDVIRFEALPQVEWHVEEVRTNLIISRMAVQSIDTWLHVHPWGVTTRLPDEILEIPDLRSITDKLYVYTWSAGTAMALVIVGVVLGLVGSSMNGRRGKMLLASAAILTILSPIILVAGLASDIAGITYPAGPPEEFKIGIFTSRGIGVLGIPGEFSTYFHLGFLQALIAAVLAFFSLAAETRSPVMPRLKMKRIEGWLSILFMILLYASIVFAVIFDMLSISVVLILLDFLIAMMIAIAASLSVREEEEEKTMPVTTS